MVLKLYYKLFSRILYFYHHKYRKGRNALKEMLLKNNQKRWLDLGSSSGYSEGFYFADIMDASELPIEMQIKYFQIDIAKPLTQETSERMGKFDFIRMQHVFEHFTWEEGITVLENCYHLLNDKGYVLITVPDLRVFVRRYLRKSLHFDWPFTDWAKTRIPENAPQSFYFSIYTHSVLHQPHKWCYDKEGLFFQFERSGKFIIEKEVSIFNKFCNIPFTHNRPFEDLCLLARKK